MRPADNDMLQTVIREMCVYIGRYFATILTFQNIKICEYSVYYNCIVFTIIGEHTVDVEAQSTCVSYYVNDQKNDEI